VIQNDTAEGSSWLFDDTRVDFIIEIATHPILRVVTSMTRTEAADATSDLPLRIAEAKVRLLMLAQESADLPALLREAIATIRSAMATERAQVACAVAGNWTTVVESGGGQMPPDDLLGDALDRQRCVSRADWIAIPLGDPRQNEVLAIRGAAKGSAASISEAMRLELSGVLASAIALVRERQRAARRIERLDAILAIAGQWNQLRETEPLLAAMAKAACRLIGADRASIFLWDRHTRTLVGKPALGVKGGELRVPESAGVVGQVFQTGEARRVSRGEGAREINRQVDQQQGYRTDSLLCVPLVGRHGQRFGAFELINKLAGDFTEEDQTALVELAAHAAVALENTRERESLVRAQQQIADQGAAGVELIGNSPAITALESTVRRVADTELAVLVLGENGTGKEVVARLIHYQSRRRGQPFIAVNCAAIAETLLESELFGHEKGAFTDAHEARAGKFELAAGGTLFLDEIGELSLAGQAKLLRVLEEKIVVRVGGSLPIHTDARVVAATNRNLAEMVRDRQFREDLYFRLNVVSLELPPLRQRGEDVLQLANHFLEQFAAKIGREVPQFTAAARQRLLSHTWPGNVRELRNLMERLAYLSPEPEIDALDLAFILSPREQGAALVAADLALADATDRFQSEYIRQAIERAGGNMSDAAERLGLHRSNLYRKMRLLGMSASDL